MINLLETLVGKQWEKIGVRQHHGIDIPLSALHSKKSCGIGEFYDLIPIIDWCASLGMDVIQLLPLNDTGDDTSPFFAISALALSPLFLSLHKLDGVEEKSLEELRKFNSYQRVPYHQVQSHKLHFLRQYFERVGPKILKTKEYSRFVANNDWLEHYALFKVLKDHMQKNHWQIWPQELKNPSRQKFDELVSSHWLEMSFYIFIQYLCFKQLKEVKAYANSKGVFLKGDIPILISPDSADVWWFQDEFDLSHIAGSPPDAYSPQGQVWGLPIFRWDVMKKRNYDWWKRRLAYASNFYDIYRIDHILGFFRIYAMEPGQSAFEGKYIPENRDEWLDHGKEILSILCNYTQMLPIGEDLGDVPDHVREVISDLGICGTKVIRWERKKMGDHPFIDPMKYNPISMSTVSTHDSETLFLWWRDEPKEAKDYAKYKGWEYNPSLTKEKQREMLRESHHTESFFHINLLGEYLALFPELVWENPEDERINIPGTVSPKNWTYRIRPSIEELVSHQALAEEIKALL